MNADPEALDALMQKVKQGFPLHEPMLFSHSADPDISITVYDGEKFLWPAFYDICQSSKTLGRIAERVQVPAKTEMRDVIDNTGKPRHANFLLEKTHAERTVVMLDYLKVLLTMKPADGDAMLKAHLQEVRQSSLGDDDDLKMDRPCAAAQLADQIGEPVVWLDISPLANDEGRWQGLMSELDRGDGPQVMKLGYLQKQGFPVFSDWHVEDGKTYLKDDRYFHVLPGARDQEMPPSDYMRTDSGLRAGATYNFVAFPKSVFERDRPAFAGLDVNEVKPRITVAGE